MDSGSSQVPPSTGGHNQINTVSYWPVVTRSYGSALS